jgi:hypothetical protein
METKPYVTIYVIRSSSSSSSSASIDQQEEVRWLNISRTEDNRLHPTYKDIRRQLSLADRPLK